MSTTAGAETTLQSGITGNTFTDTGLTNGATYFYVVTASNARGESPASNEVSATRTAVSTLNPAGTDQDGRIHIIDLTSYGAAWKTGALWPTPPNRIPITYITDVGYLWKTGEVYHYDSSQVPPWASGSASASWPALTGNGAVDARRPATPVVGQSMHIVLADHPNALTHAYAVEEKIPAGWRIVSLAGQGTFNPKTGVIRWGPFLDGQPRQLSYVAVPSAGAGSGFRTSMSFDSRSAQAGGPQPAISAPGETIPPGGSGGRGVHPLCRARVIIR